jgi:Sulfotransferase family
MKRPEPHGRETAGSSTAVQAPAAGETGGAGAALVQERRVPDFFIIGHQKCGTTALYMMLRDHPQIFLPEYKEPRFFAPELRPAPERETPDRPQTLERYLALFEGAGSEQRAGEASPQYIRSPTAAGRIAELAPDARIIAIMREPASFLRSYHMQMVASHVETEKDFRKAIGLEARRRRAGDDGSFVRPQFLYSEHVRYVEQLSRFHSAFPREHVLVLIYDDFRRDNEATVREVQRFLEVDDSVPLRTVETEPLEAVRSMRLHQFRRAVARADFNPAAAGPVTRAMTMLTPGRLRSGPISSIFRRVAYRSSAPPDEQFTRELRRRFKPEVVALSDYLGRDLVSLWGYDELT